MIIESYIDESRPISSGYLCQKHHLAYSPATVRNIMLELEQRGYISHIHTSSGRVPTKEGFKHYVENIDEEKVARNCPEAPNVYPSPETTIPAIIDDTLDALTSLSGYASLVAVSGPDARIFFKGMRFILEQPEFEDVHRLRNIFYLLEEKMDVLQTLLLGYIDDKVRIIIGDDIGCSEFSDCSLVVSGLQEKDITVALSILGPMRMNYIRSISCLRLVTRQLKAIVEEIL